jgi:hypothetical protein
LLRCQLEDRYASIAKRISQQRRADASRKANNLRKGFQQTQSWIEKRSAKNRGKKRSAECKAKISASMRARKSTGRDKESYVAGAAKARETKLKNGVYERHAVLMANLHAAGEFQNSGQRYGVKSCYQSTKTGKTERCDSNFELSRMKQLDVDDQVTFWTKAHGITIKYTKSTGSVHRYVPDFMIYYVDGSRTLEELKGRNYDPEVNRLKFEALQVYCREHGFAERWTWQKIKDRF